MENITISVPKPEMSDYEKKNAATEAAFNTLVAEAGRLQLSLKPVMGLMYLPDQALTVQFQQACRAVLDSLLES